jgi:hypothetical protein
MKKLLLAATMALGLGISMGSAFAATGWSSSQHPQVIHNGPDYGADAGGAP